MTTEFEAKYHFSLSMRNIHRMLETLSQIASKEDIALFYEELNLAAFCLNNAPSYSTNPNGWKNVSIHVDESATANLLQHKLGTKNSIRAFSAACASLDAYMESSFIPDVTTWGMDGGTVVEVEHLLSTIETNTGFFSAFNKSNAYMQILIVPAQSTPQFQGTVSIHSANRAENASPYAVGINVYTLVIPLHTRRFDIRTIDICIAELAVVMADMFVRQQNDSCTGPEITLPKRREQKNSGFIPSVTIERKGYHNTPQHARKVASKYRSIAANIKDILIQTSGPFSEPTD